MSQRILAILKAPNQERLAFPDAAAINGGTTP